MKKYKKALLVAPLACVLSTSFFTLPNGAQAAETKQQAYIDTYQQGTVATKENVAKTLKNRLLWGIEKSPELRAKFKLADDERFQREQGGTSFTDPSGKTTRYPAVNYGLDSQIGKLETVFSGTSASINPTAITLENDGVVNVVTYNNTSPLTQSLATPEVTKTYSRTFNLTSKFGMKLGFEASTKIQVGLPGLVNGEIATKASSEYSMGMDIGHSTTQTETLTFKSQTIQAAANGTTDYFYRVKKAKFSGTFNADAYLSGVTLKLPIVKIATTTNNVDGNKVVHTEEATLTAEDLYTLYKVTNSIPLPPYMKFDDQSKKVVINTEFSYEGEGGFYTQAQAKFTPNTNTQGNTMPGSFNPSQTMKYEDYVKAIQNKTL
ncbi:hypothetical protein IGI01_22440 [Bacillus thuringiensis]|nr:hypothetical protein [Bacillus thuringiensis]